MAVNEGACTGLKIFNEIVDEALHIQSTCHSTQEKVNYILLLVINLASNLDLHKIILAHNSKYFMLYGDKAKMHFNMLIHLKLLFYSICIAVVICCWKHLIMTCNGMMIFMKFKRGRMIHWLCNAGLH